MDGLNLIEVKTSFFKKIYVNLIFVRTELIYMEKNKQKPYFFSLLLKTKKLKFPRTG